ncbi:MAG: hypothetical protein LAO76_11005 [Acidobacteriia bacterium]|nr:hypothetical protein [Terriglobia bacterium]
MEDERMDQNNIGDSILKEMHKAFLEALRQREQEIFTYLTTLGLAFGGFAWLLVQQNSKEPPPTTIPFLFGTMGVLFLLCLGAVYAAALGYNYRYLTFQLAKIEDFLKIKEVILRGWPRTVREFEKYSRWCDPPEIIKVFWFSFIAGIPFVTWFAAKVSGLPVRIWLWGGVFFCIGTLSPGYFALRFGRLLRKETHWSERQSETARS